MLHWPAQPQWPEPRLLWSTWETERQATGRGRPTRRHTGQSCATLLQTKQQKFSHCKVRFKVILRLTFITFLKSITLKYNNIICLTNSVTAKKYLIYYQVQKRTSPNVHIWGPGTIISAWKMYYQNSWLPCPHSQHCIYTPKFLKFSITILDIVKFMNTIKLLFQGGETVNTWIHTKVLCCHSCFACYPHIQTVVAKQ